MINNCLEKVQYTALADKTCSGCSACFNICPQRAISMEENAEGFLYPQIDKDKCNNCGLCTKICPVLHPDFSNRSNPDCIAAMADDNLRKEILYSQLTPTTSWIIGVRKVWYSVSKFFSKISSLHLHYSHGCFCLF